MIGFNRDFEVEKVIYLENSFGFESWRDDRKVHGRSLSGMPKRRTYLTEKFSSVRAFLKSSSEMSVGILLMTTLRKRSAGSVNV